MCQEIAENVCEFLDPSYYHRGKSRHTDKYKSKEYKSTLARLARTCKAFSDPALRVLWRRLDGINNLLQLLPQYTYPKPSTYWMAEPELPKLLSAEPDDDGWTRLQSYAIRVRQLKFCDWARVDHSTWMILSKRCNGAPLFPLLKRLLDFNVRSSDCEGAIVRLLFPPSLRSVTLFFDSWFEDEEDPRPFRDILQHIVARVPDVQHLALGRGIGRCASLHPITGLQSTTSLSFAPDISLDDVILAHCASLPTLRDLSCRVHARHATKLPSMRGAFQLLTRISLHGSAEDIVWFFKETSVASLRDISLVFDRTVDTDELLQSILEVLKVAPRSLRKFSMKMIIARNSPEPISLIEAIEPLLGLRHLQELTATSNHPFSLSAEDLIRMVTAWPDIRVLDIHDDRTRSALSVLPAHVLEQVAHRCPCLETLKLPRVDFTGLPPQAHEPVLDHDLVDLGFYPVTSSYHNDSDDEQEDSDSPGVVDWLNAALFIDRLFPRLDSDAEGEKLIMSDKSGTKLANLLSALRIGRRHAEAFDRMRVDSGGEPSCDSARPPILS
ncbi:hypothetical protein K466DRAFT_656436 [Polyporus arcularius HHB13444]|uniref:F-box domain-containing protein n=1 Tax=Polyporus arcularius HHB13444 TaxID=1314778 RepID=A0A5C3NXR0_9APHY|nr:hypothetical protein K466DRAFT_656436 [Polyporus arcularius HHB13444]